MSEFAIGNRVNRILDECGNVDTTPELVLEIRTPDYNLMTQEIRTDRQENWTDASNYKKALLWDVLKKFCMSWGITGDDIVNKLVQHVQGLKKDKIL